MANYLVFSLTFRIPDGDNDNGDDKEHQDDVTVRITSATGDVLYPARGKDGKIVPMSCNNGDDSDQNKFYWPSTGPGRHDHTFILPLSGTLSVGAVNGAHLEITSSNGDGGCSDFESWNAYVSILGIADDNSEHTIKLDGQDRPRIAWSNGDNRKTNSLRLSD